MPDLIWLADLGRASVGALWLPVAAWSAVALVVEAALRASRPGAALALPVRGAVLAALPLAVAVPAALGALALAAVPTFVPDPTVWLPEVSVGGPAPGLEAGAPSGPPIFEAALGAAVVLALGLALVHAVRLGAELARVRRSQRRLVAPGHGAQAAVDAARARLGVARPVAAVEAPAGTAPFTVGWRRPVVALPPGLEGPAREVAALHEVAHVRRADFAWHAAQRAVAAVFAAHPLVWALGRGLDLDRERAADALVLEACPDRRRTYADLLFSYAALPAPALALGAARGSSALKTRIDAMTRPLSPSRARRLGRLGRALGLGALALVAGLAATTAPASGPAPPSLEAADPPGLEADRPAADRTVEGVVRDADTGAGIAMANLLVVGTSAGASTDADGRYRLEAPDGAQVVRVSASGYVTREVALPAGATELDVALTVTSPLARTDGPAPSDADVFEVVDEMPVLIGGLAGLQERVVYPQSARDEGVEGQVILQFVVDEDGAVTEPRVLRSPDDRLTEAALEAVSQVRFEPGVQRGRPVKVRFAVPITFRLPSEDQGSNARPRDGSERAAPARVGYALDGSRLPVRYAGVDVSRLSPGSRQAFVNTFNGIPDLYARDGRAPGDVEVRYTLDDRGRASQAEYVRGDRSMMPLAAFLVGTIELDEGARPGRGGSAPGTFRLWYLGEG